MSLREKKIIYHQCYKQNEFMWQEILIYLMAAQRDVRYVVNQGRRFAL